VDGFRVDTATFPQQEFLMELRQDVKSANPDALLFGETWVHNPSDMRKYYVDQFDAFFDLPLYEVLQGNRDFNGDGILAGEGFPVLLTTLFNEEAEKLPREAINGPLDGISVEEQDLNRDSLLNYYRNLIDLRKSHKALHEGDFEVAELETSRIGSWGFVSSSGDESILALYNFGSDEQEVVLDEFPFNIDELIDLITENGFPSPTPGIEYK